MSQDNEEHFPPNINPQINQVIQNQENHLPNQQQNNQNQQQFNQNQQQFNQNQQQFNPNQQQFNPNQFAFFQNQMPPFFNMNPMFNPQMTQEQRQQMEQQQKMLNEMKKQQAIQMGKTLLEQKKMMENIHRMRKEREEKRKTCEMVIFFKYNDDILPITVKADQFLFELLQEYINQSGNQNVKFFFHGQELVYNQNSPTVLHEINELRTGEEIIVKSAQ